MALEGKYIYGIIESNNDHRFGPIGLHGEEVLTIGMDNLAVVMSHYSSDEEEYVTSSRNNLLTHQKVIERVMEEHTLLPVKFGTIAQNEAEVNNLLLKHYKGFLSNLKRLDHKIELGVKAFWTDMPSVYKDILENNQKIQDKKIQIQGTQTTNDLIEVGQMVEEALLEKKQAMADQLLGALNPIALDTSLGKLMAEPMFLNASFLVSKGREKEFDNQVEELAELLGSAVKLKYVGPLAPYNFVDLDIKQENWEA